MKQFENNSKVDATKITMVDKAEIEQLYQTYWQLLFSIAYRLLGTRLEAEDIVQDVFLSLQSVEREHIENMKAFLCKSVTNRCLNLLKSAKKKRELYVGSWLPEPLYDDDSNEPLRQIEQREEISYAYLVMLDQLSPIERVAFVLREAFGYEYQEIAEIVAKSAENCRKICSRARQKMKESEPHRLPSPEHDTVVMQFIDLVRTGKIADVISLLSDQVVFISDGGGKVKSALRPIIGRERVMAFMIGISRKGSLSYDVDPVRVNGQTGLKVQRGDMEIPAVWAFSFDEATGLITHIYGIYNPDKLHPVS